MTIENVAYLTNYVSYNMSGTYELRRIFRPKRVAVT
jgi:hypothetical protein